MSSEDQTRRLSRRQLLRLIGGGAAATGLSMLATACGDTGTQPGGTGPGTAAQTPAQAGGVTTLQFITPAAVGRERDLYTSFIQGFEQENPDIKVNVSFEAWNDYMTKLPTILASGNVPDVIHQHMSIVQDYGARGGLMDLSALMQRDSVKPEDYIPALFEAFSDDGKVFALPKDSAAWGIYYNKDMFDAAGLTYPADDWTLEDFVRYAIELTRDQNNNPASSPNFDRNNIKQWGFVWLEPTPTTSEVTRGFVKAFGGDWYNEAYTETLINDPQVQAYFEMMHELRCTHNATPTAAQATGQGDPFRTGLVAMAQSFHVMDFFIREEKVTFNYDVTFLPKGPGGQFVPVGASGWAIPAKAANPEASWKLVRYLTSNQVQVEIGKIGRWGVARKEAIAAIVPQNAVPGFKKVHVDPLQGNSDRTPISFKFPAKQSQIRQIYSTELDAVWNCTNDDIAGAATTVKEQVDPLLQEG